MTRSRLNDFIRLARPAVAAVAAACAVPALAAPPAASLFERVDPGVAVERPRVRIALRAPDREVRLGGTGGAMRLIDGVTGDEVWPGRAAGDVRVVAVGDPVPDAGSVFRVQVGSFRGERAARELATRLEREHAEPAEAIWQASRGVWRVRVGRAGSSAALGGLLRTLRASGFPDAWVAEERAPVLANASLRLVDERWSAHDPPSRRIVAVPVGGGLLTVEGRPYRGLVEIVLSEVGTLTAVNEVNLEEYLRGVVPEELGPAKFPELEALKAQAVAARTYVVGNLGQFAEEGYDICDTPRCQVYGGAATEHPLSDRAIRETRGLVLMHGREPINAMYTSTCGGHTEDVEVVFPDMRAPYLRGVPCIAERRQLERRRVTVRGREVPEEGAAASGRGREGTLALMALVAHGLAPRAALDPGWRAAPATAEDVRRLGALLAERAGVPPPGATSEAPTRREAWLAWSALLPGSLGPHGRVSETAIALVLGSPDADGLPPEERRTVAGLLSLGVIAPDADGRLRPDAAPTRGELLAWQARLAEVFDAAPLARGSVARGSRGRLAVRMGRTERAYPLEPPPDVVQEAGGRWFRVPELDLWPGDAVELVVLPGAGAGTLALVAVPERKGLYDDRTSSRFRWELAKDRVELERTLRDVAPVGRLRDLTIRSRGVSGRVAELEVAGTRDVSVVEGFRLRRALGLPETLFEMDLQREDDGLLRRVVFRGRGWGHGVGLCQVGAYGMAQRGESFRDILGHYYSGVRLRRYAGH